MMRMIYILLMSIAVVSCASLPSAEDLSAADDFDREIEFPSMMKKTTAGSIYQSSNNISLFEDIKARAIGDILTIVLSEQTSASKSASISTAKENAIGFANPTLLGTQPQFKLPGPFGGSSMTFATDINSDKSFSGEGDSSQSNQLTGSITVIVTEIFPNSNLRIKGKKRIKINQGDEYLMVTGIVRPQDIRANNTVLSTHVANAKMSYSGTGVVANSNEMGWLSRFFNSKWWPF